MLSTQYALTFLVSLLFALLFTPVVCLMLERFGVIDQPDERRVHKIPVPRGGGLAVFAACHLGAALLCWGPPLLIAAPLPAGWWLSFLLGSLLLLIVGLIDDVFSLRPLLKLCGQTGASALMFTSDVRVGGVFGLPFPEWLDVIVTMLWFLTIINAFNLIDGFDGVAAGLAAIAAVGIGGTLVVRELHAEAAFLCGFAGACLGFLRYNLPPARLFLGDTGSMFLGFTLAAITLSTASKGTGLAAIWVPLLALGVPVFDTFLAVWRRSARSAVAFVLNQRRSGGIMTADMDHLHHRLVKLGLNSRNVTASLYLVSSGLVLAGLSSLVYRERALGVCVLTFLTVSVVAARCIAGTELWESGLLVAHGLGDRRRPLAALLSFAVLDCAALSGSLLASFWLTSTDAAAAEVLGSWMVALPLWAGLPFLVVLLLETLHFRRFSEEMPDQTRRILAWILCSGALFALIGVRLAAGSDLLILRVLVYAGLSYAAYTALRHLPSFVTDLMNRRKGPA